MTAAIGDKVLALEPKKQSAFAKAVKNVQKLKEKKEVTPSKYKRGIILLHHIPHGFFESEMREYFKQFGHVLRIRLARSKKTGRSKGYAFIEFEFEEVAKIAAECMDGYLMYERLLKCEIVSSDVNPNKIFSARFMSEDNYPKLHARNKVKAEQCKTKSEEKVKEFLQFRLRKLEEQNKKLAEMGIEYKFETGHNVDNPTLPVTTTKKEKKNKPTTTIKEIPKFSPKVLRSKGRDSLMFQETPKFSPKSLRKEAREPSTKQEVLKLSPISVRDKPSRSNSSSKLEIPKSSRKSISNKPRNSTKQEIPKFSPKLLRNKARESTNKQETPKSSPKLLRNKARDSTIQKSPKNLRNKTRDSSNKQELPKFSPKLLRSRASIK